MNRDDDTPTPDEVKAAEEVADVEVEEYPTGIEQEDYAEVQIEEGDESFDLPETDADLNKEEIE